MNWSRTTLTKTANCGMWKSTCQEKSTCLCSVATAAVCSPVMALLVSESCSAVSSQCGASSPSPLTGTADAAAASFSSPHKWLHTAFDKQWSFFKNN